MLFQDQTRATRIHSVLPKPDWAREGQDEFQYVFEVWGGNSRFRILIIRKLLHKTLNDGFEKDS